MTGIPCDRRRFRSATMNDNPSDCRRFRPQFESISGIPSD